MTLITNTLNPYQDPFSYSNWENEQVRSVNWAKLPTTRPLKWHEVTKIRNAVSHVLMVLATATSAALFFTITSIACTSLLIGSLALLITGIYLRMQKDNPLDPDFRMKERNDIKESFYIPHIGMLNSLVIRFVITENEKQALLHQDIYDTDYDVFIEKHGQIIFDELDNQNLSFLKLKFLAYLSNCEIRDLTDIEKILDSKANQYFNLTEADLLPFLITENSLEESNESTLTQLTSQVSSYAIPIFKFATNIYVPSSVKAAGQLAMTSLQLAYQGKTKASAIYAFNALTCLFIHSTKSMMKTLYPEAYKIAKQQMMYEKAFNSGY